MGGWQNQTRVRWYCRSCCPRITSWDEHSRNFQSERSFFVPVILACRFHGKMLRREIFSRDHSSAA